MLTWSLTSAVERTCSHLMGQVGNIWPCQCYKDKLILQINTFSSSFYTIDNFMKDSEWCITREVVLVINKALSNNCEAIILASHVSYCSLCHCAQGVAKSLWGWTYLISGLVVSYCYIRVPHSWILGVAKSLRGWTSFLIPQQASLILTAVVSGWLQHHGNGFPVVKDFNQNGRRCSGPKLSTESSFCMTGTLLGGHNRLKWSLHRKL